MFLLLQIFQFLESDDKVSQNPTSLEKRLSDILINEFRVTSYELLSLRVALVARVTSYQLLLLHELQVTFYIQITSYRLLYELQVNFIARVTSRFLHGRYELLFISRVTSYFSRTSYELVFIA